MATPAIVRIGGGEQGQETATFALDRMPGVPYNLANL
jgi:hypothetical protein